MLLEFRVSNFRSIRDEQVFSMVAASSDKTFADTHLAPTGLKGLPNVVRSAVVYGANASGKSTLLMAMQYMRTVVAESATKIKPNQLYNVQPFKPDPARLGEPTSFVLSFLMQGVRYEYAFAMRPERFVSESLTVYRTARPTLLFNRQLATDGQSYDYEFSSLLPGPKRLWQDSTRPNALFLSTATQLNSDLLGQVFSAIALNTVYIPAGATVNYDLTTALLRTEEGRKAVRIFLTEADMSIADVQAVSRKGVQDQIIFGAEGQTQTNRIEGEFILPVFEHKTPQGSATFELHEESQGTQRLFGLIAPLKEVLKKGQTLVVDELDSSLHTLLVRQLVSMFHSTETNPLGAQLIFSTHDTALQDKLHFAIHGHTSAELIKLRADAKQPKMGLTSYKNEKTQGRVTRADVTVGKNYLSEPELQDLNRLVGMYLDFAEGFVRRQIPMKMQDWIDKLNEFLRFNAYPVLASFGNITRERAEQRALAEFDKFRTEQDRDYRSDFDEVVEQIKINKKLPRSI